MNRTRVEGVRMVEDVLDGKTIMYTTATTFEVQVGKGSKGKYETRYKVTGNLAQAVKLYNAINIGRGFKKRLFMVNARNPVLAKQTS